MLKRKRPHSVVGAGLPHYYAVGWGREGTFNMYTATGWENFYNDPEGQARAAASVGKNTAKIDKRDGQTAKALVPSTRNIGAILSGEAGQRELGVKNATFNSSITETERNERRARKRLKRELDYTMKRVKG